MIRKKIFTFTSILLILLLLPGVFAVKQLVSLQGKIVDNNGNLINDANVTVTIWDSETGGTLIYNSTTNFENNITNGFFDIMLGSITDLNLNLSQTYYMDLMIENEDIDWDGNERRQFQSPVGYAVSGTNNFTVDTNVLFVDVLNNRVGIGTSSPGANLDVDGTIIGRGPGSGSGTDIFQFYDGTTIVSAFDVSGGNLRLIGGDSSKAPINILTSDSISRLFVSSKDKGGNVGIGTSSPTERLTVYGGNVSFKNASGNAMLFVDNKTGNVGIGTTSPDYALQIDMDPSASTGGFFAITKGAPGGTHHFALIIEDPSSATDTYNLGVATGSVPSLVMSSENGANREALVFSDGSVDDTAFGISTSTDSGSTWNPSLVVKINGKVGIGTTAPLNTLHVNGSGAQGGFRVTNESGQNIFFVNSTSGRVGIGTSNPAYDLQVANDGGSSTISITALTDFASLYLGSTGTPTLGQIRYGTGNDFMSFYTGGDEEVRITNVGNVGIGTTKPGQKLHVVGSVNVSQTLNAPVINTTRADENITISSGGGSVIIRLG